MLSLLRAISSIYSRVYQYLPIPVRRAARSIYRFFADGSPDSSAVESIAGFYRLAGVFRENDLVFDIGANVGQYAAAFESLGARVVAVEPDPSSASILEKKFAGSKKVAIVRKGVGEREGLLGLHVSGSRVSSTFSESFRRAEERDYKTDYVGTVQVPVTTLDALVAEYGMPSYCKIDVEGFERQVLSGLSKRIPAISFEFHSSLLGEAEFCLDLLEKRGYEFCLRPQERAPWAGARELAGQIRSQSLGKKASGDVFARLRDAEVGPSQ